MALMDLPLGERLRVLQDLLSCTGKMYAWCYDAEGKLIDTNCPDRVLDDVFSTTGCMEAVRHHAREHREPILLSIPYGLSWSAAFEFDGDGLQRIHVFGPTTTTELGYDGISKAVWPCPLCHHPRHERRRRGNTYSRRLPGRLCKPLVEQEQHQFQRLRRHEHLHRHFAIHHLDHRLPSCGRRSESGSRTQGRRLRCEPPDLRRHRERILRDDRVGILRIKRPRDDAARSHHPYAQCPRHRFQRHCASNY